MKWTTINQRSLGATRAPRHTDPRQFAKGLTAKEDKFIAINFAQIIENTGSGKVKRQSNVHSIALLFQNKINARASFDSSSEKKGAIIDQRIPHKDIRVSWSPNNPW